MLSAMSETEARELFDRVLEAVLRRDADVLVELAT